MKSKRTTFVPLRETVWFSSSHHDIPWLVINFRTGPRRRCCKGRRFLGTYCSSIQCLDTSSCYSNIARRGKGLWRVRELPRRSQNYRCSWSGVYCLLVGKKSWLTVVVLGLNSLPSCIHIMLRFVKIEEFHPGGVDLINGIIGVIDVLV